MPLTVSNPARQMLNRETLYMATAYQLRREDGVRYFWTNHDHDVVFPYAGAPGAQTYVADGAVSVSNIRKQSGLQPHNANGYLAVRADGATTEQIAAGFWRRARLIEIVYSWMYPHVGAVIGAIYWLGRERWTGEEFEFEIGGISQWLEKPQGVILKRTCRHKLGEAFGAASTVVGCRADVASNTVSKVIVDSVTDNIAIDAVDATIPTQADDYYKHGEVVWRSGANTGLPAMPVEGYTDTGRIVTLRRKAPLTIEAGDVFDLKRGCGGDKASCNGWGQFPDNFGGFLFTPTPDEITPPNSDESAI